MKFPKVILASAALLLAAGLAFSETTVEDDYLSSVEDVIIAELAQSDDRDNKLVALQMLEDAINSGRNSAGLVAALDSLAGEGTKTIVVNKGHQTNNFPDIRAKACDLLAQIHTEESKNTLITIALEDKEPWVVTAAIRGLGEVGLNDNNDAIAAIAWALKQDSALKQTSSLAYEALDAYEKLFDTIDTDSNIADVAG